MFFQALQLFSLCQGLVAILGFVIARSDSDAAILPQLSEIATSLSLLAMTAGHGVLFADHRENCCSPSPTLDTTPPPHAFLPHAFRRAPNFHQPTPPFLYGGRRSARAVSSETDPAGRPPSDATGAFFMSDVPVAPNNQRSNQ
jgi:hypothetical protein